jgi:hypothetical protein
MLGSAGPGATSGRSTQLAEQHLLAASAYALQVDMMTQHYDAEYRPLHQQQQPSQIGKVRYAIHKQYKAVRLPYKWSAFSAVAVLPSKQLASKGIAAVAAQLLVDALLDPANWTDLDEGGLDLFLPKFTVKSPPVSLKKVRSL